MVFNEKYLMVVVDEQEEELARISEIFENKGYEVNAAINYDQLLFCIEEDIPDMIIINFRKNIEVKKELFEKFRSNNKYRDLPILGIFDSVAPEVIDEYIEHGIESICTYPFTNKEILLRSEHIVEIVHNRKEIEKKDLALGAMYEEVKVLKLDIKTKMDEITKLKDTINRVVIIDPLTGLFNRTYAFEQLEMAIARFNRKKIISSIILCNIDDFTEVNGEFGHNVGDRVLKEVSLSLSKNKRNQDVFARYSSDTYMIILPDTDIEGAKFFAERARAIIENTKLTDNNISITMTFGVAIYNQAMSVDMTMKMVEDSLRFGKQSGKNKVVVGNELLNLF